jgi:hypothetical protein
MVKDLVYLQFGRFDVKGTFPVVPQPYTHIAQEARGDVGLGRGLMGGP